MDHQIHTLQNGIRIIHAQINSTVSHCGVLINAGSRDEEINEHGLAHFTEHMLFKGTKKRRSYHIVGLIENNGGEINAYTTKEETCIYSTFLNGDYNKSLDVFSDILTNSVFAKKDITNEKEVIIDEINSYKDNPSEIIFDDFEELIFPNETIGRNILGSRKSLKKFENKNIKTFINNNYFTNEIVISSVGNISFKRLIKLVERYFGEIPEKLNPKKRKLSFKYQAVHKTTNKKTHQAHCLIGNIAYHIKDERRIALQLLNNLLGGQGLNSRLNLSLREKHGYAYNVESNYNPYCDTGVISIYFGTEKENIEKSIAIINKELKNLKDNKLGTLQLSKAKKQLMGQIAISSELNENLMLSSGKSLLVFNQLDSLEILYQKIDAIKTESLIDISNEIFDNNQLSTLIYK